jgi:hypothetical protein
MVWTALAACRSEEPHPPAPASLGAGFEDLTPTLPATFPRVVRPDEDPIGTAGLLADLDGDGRTELVLSVSNDQSPSAGAALVYRFDEGASRFVAGPVVPVSDRTLVLAAADLDGDGLVDLLTGTPDARVAWGDPAGAFGSSTRLDSPALIQGSTSIGTAALDDLDDDGWLDVLLGNERCCATCQALHPFLRTGPRSYVDRPDLVIENPVGGLYAVMATTPRPGARLLGAFGAGCGERPPAFFRASSVGEEGLPRFPAFDPTPPDAVYRREASAERPCPSIDCRSPMGAAWGDLDGDGQLDLAISLDPLHAFFRGGSEWMLADRSEGSLMEQIRSDGGRPMLPWGSALLDLDLDGRADVVTVHGDDHEAATNPASHIGPQYATVHWNGGDFRFADVTSLAHLGRRGQWRSLFVGDLDRDGDPDLVVGGLGEAPRVYRNAIATGNAGLALRLRGSTSNALGLGARVLVWPTDAGASQSFVVGGSASPFVVSDPMVFVGLGRANSAARVRVTWPSGTIQELRDLRSGAVHLVEEPVLFDLSPAARHLPADGRSEAVLRITPRAPDGSVRTEARVEAGLAYGTGRIAAPPAREGDAWVVRVVAPTTPGSGVVVVRVDGVAAGIRPRLWWD